MREGGEMSSNSNVEEERLAGVPRRPRKDGEISSNKESTWRVWQEVETNSNTEKENVETNRTTKEAERR